jgi:integrase|tara:strand:+ start:2562 stop:4214 length:1653 start_codon:yes stop_codon:yes gene_type:complete
MAEVTKDSTLREVLTYYAKKNKRKDSFVTEGVKLFKDIADKKGSALELFTPDKDGKTLLNRTLNSIDVDTISLKQPMQNLRQVGLTLKGVIPESDSAYNFLPDAASNSEKNLKIFGIEEPAKAKSLVSIKVNPETMNQLFSKIEEFKLDPKTEAIADAMLFNINTGLRPNAAAGLKVGGVYFPESGAIYIDAETKGAKGRRINVPLSPLADSILQKRIADGKVVNDQFFVKPDGKVVTSSDMTKLLKQIKIKDFMFDAATNTYYDSLAPEGKEVPGKRGSSLFRNIHTKIGQKAGVAFERIAYLQGRSLVSAATGSVGEVVTYATDFPGDIDPKGFDAQQANKISSIFQPSVEKYNYNLSGTVPRITKATEGFSTYFDAPVVDTSDTIEGTFKDVTDKPVNSFKDLTIEEIEELKSFGIEDTPDESILNKVAKSPITKGVVSAAGVIGSTVAKSSPIVAAGLEYQMSKDEGKGEFESISRGAAEAVNPLPVGIREFEQAGDAVAAKTADDSSISDSGSFLDALTGSLTGQSLNLSGGFASGGFVNRQNRR